MRPFVLKIAALLLFISSQMMAQEHHRLTNLPHLYINTFNGKNITSKTTQVLSRLWLVDENDEVAFYDSVLIRGRGNSTWRLAKKPYHIKFPKKIRFLGEERANAKKWNLLANHGDKTLFRNALASYIGDLCGQVFTPAAKFVDLTLNGKYIGSYQITDQVDVRKKRVDIKEQDVPLTEESNITGGYLIEADGFKDHVSGVNGWTTPKGVPMTIHYPDDEEIENSQFTYISKFVNDFETRLFANYFDDAEKGYRALVDSTSLASWYLASEIAGEPDYVWSMYYYKERNDDHLYFGPIWDCDIAFDNDNRLGDTTNSLMADVSHGQKYAAKWITRIWADKWFQRLVFRNYVQLYSQGLKEKILNKIDSLQELLQKSQQLNYQKWDIDVRTLRERVLYSTYDEYVDHVRRFVSNRMPALLYLFADRQPDDVDLDEFDKVIPGYPTSPSFYHVIANVGTATVFDINDDGKVVGNATIEDSHSQQWQIITLQNGYQQILNRMNGKALTDPTQGAATETTNIGAQLMVTIPDSTDKAQQWHIVKQAEGRYNLNNRKTRHTANLSKGNPSNGTAIQSYTNNERNATSDNRMWDICVVDSIQGHETDLRQVENVPMDYALAYNPTTHFLHFGADDPEQLSFNVDVYDQLGRRVMQFPARKGASIEHLPEGLYILTWYYNGKHSVKLLR